MSVLVRQVTPNNLITGQSREIALAGAGFSGNVMVTIAGISIPAFFVADRMVKFVLPFVPAGTYDITVANGDGSRWTSRQVLTVSDADLGDLGSAQRPIVLPPVQISSKSNAQLSPAAKYRDLNSAATIKVDSTSGVISATLKQDMSYLPTEPVQLPEKPTAGQVIESPWGTFKNE